MCIVISNMKTLLLMCSIAFAAFVACGGQVEVPPCQEGELVEVENGLSPFTSILIRDGSAYLYIGEFPDQEAPEFALALVKASGFGWTRYVSSNGSTLEGASFEYDATLPNIVIVEGADEFTTSTTEVCYDR